MTTRTKLETVSFQHPFKLSAIDDMQPPGQYIVEIDEERLEGVSLEAHRRVATIIHVGGVPGSNVTARMVPIDPAELAAALARDAQPQDLTPPSPVAVPPERAISGVEEETPMTVLPTAGNKGRRHAAWTGPFARRAGRPGGAIWHCGRNSR